MRRAASPAALTTRQSRLAAAVALALAAGLACDGYGSSFEAHPETLRFDAHGDTARIQLVGADGISAPGQETLFASSNTTVATVDADGRVVSVADGTAAVHVRRGAARDSVVVIVDQRVSDILLEAGAPATLSATQPGDTARIRVRGVDSQGNQVADAVFAVASTDSTVARPLPDLRVALAFWGAATVVVTADDARREIPTQVAPAWDTLTAVAPSDITALWVRNADEIHAGLANGGVAVYSGGGWTTTALPSCPSGPTSIAPIPGGGAVAISTDGCGFRFDGTAWSVDPAMPTGPLTGVAAVSDPALWVSSFGALYRYDGAVWDAESLPVPLAERSFRTVSALAADAVYAAGAALVRWNGARWAEIPTGTTDPITHVWGAADSLYAAADSTRLRTGGAWRAVDALVPGAGTEVVPGLDGFLILRTGGLFLVSGTRVARLPGAPGGQALGWHPEQGVVVAAGRRLYRTR